MSDNLGWTAYGRSNIHVKGQGIDKTILNSPVGNTTAFQTSYYRTGGWNDDDSAIMTFEDNVTIGQGWFDVRAGQTKELQAIMKKGSIGFINGGGHYLDQWYGEMFVVDTVIGRRVYMTTNTVRDYTVARSEFTDSTLEQFITPDSGQTVVAKITGYPGVGATFSVGNDLYKVMASNGSQYWTLKNLGKGSTPGTVVPRKTRIFKMRAIVLPLSVSVNTMISDMTINAHGQGFINSNTFGFTAKNIKLNIQRGLEAKAYWLNGDGGRLTTLENVSVYSDSSLSGSQVARCFVDTRFINCDFHNIGIEFTENAIDVLVRGCKWYMTARPGNLSSGAYSINVGHSTSGIIIEDNEFFSDGLQNVVAAYSDVLNTTSRGATFNSVSRNIFNVKDVGAVISLVNQEGVTYVDDNKIVGSCRSPFGSTDGWAYSDTNTQFSTNRIFNWGQGVFMRRNTFEGYTDKILERADPENLVFEKNTIISHGTYSTPPLTTTGNVVDAAATKEPATRFIFKDNDFFGWRYGFSSIKYARPMDSHVDISNNRFYRQTGTDRKDKDFVVTLKDEHTAQYGSLDLLAAQKNKETDWGIYQIWVQENGGVLSNSDTSALKRFIRGIYANGLREYAGIFYPLAGDILLPEYHY